MIRIAMGSLLAAMTIGCGVSATEKFVSREAAQTFAKEMTTAMNEAGFLSQMSGGAGEFVKMIAETGTIDKWVSTMSGEFIDPSLIIEQYERKGLKIGIEGGAGQIDVDTGGLGSALTTGQQSAMNNMIAELVATGDPAKVAFARELLDVMRRAQGIPQVPLGRTDEPAPPE